MDVSTAHMTVYGLVKTSDKSVQEIADCIGKTRQMLHLALTTDKYPLILVEVLECLGYKARLRQEIIAEIPKGEVSK